MVPSRTAQSCPYQCRRPTFTLSGVTSPAGAPKPVAVLATLVVALVLLRHGSRRVGAIHEIVAATHELVTDCYHDLRAIRVGHDGDRAPSIRSITR